MHSIISKVLIIWTQPSVEHQTTSVLLEWQKKKKLKEMHDHDGTKTCNDMLRLETQNDSKWEETNVLSFAHILT